MSRVILGALLALLVACSPSGSEPKAPDVLRRGLSGEPATLDPPAAVDTYSLEVIRDLYQGLTDESPAGDAIPGVAESWSVDASGLIYTFHLRPNARWSDGKPVTAQDFLSSWLRTLDPKRAAPNAEILSLIEGASDIVSRKAPASALNVSAPNEHELVVHLARPAPYFPSILSHPASFPVYSDAMAKARDASHWISNGPYTLDSWRLGANLTLKRNDQYWDAAPIAVPGIEYVVSADEYQQSRNYRASGLDLTDNVPSSELPTLRQSHAKELILTPFLGTVYLGLNLTQAPYATHPELRQALAMAIDRERIVKHLNGGQAPAYGFVPSGTWNYRAQTWDWRALPDAERTTQARALYEKAGYSRAKPLHLRLLYNANPGIRETMVAVAGMWREVLGVETEVMEQEYRVFLDTRHDHAQWSVVRLAWSADYNDAETFLDILMSHSVNNDEAYASSAYDDTLDRAARTLDADARRQLLESAEKSMLADYPIVPLYQFVSRRLVKPYVRGAHPTPLNHLASRYLSLETTSGP